MNRSSRRPRLRRLARLSSVGLVAVALSAAPTLAGATSTTAAIASADTEAAETIADYCAADEVSAAGVTGVPEAVTDRVCGWVAAGLDPEALLETFRQLPPDADPGTPAWVETFVAAGDAEAEQARQAEEGNRPAGLPVGRLRALDGWSDAALYYFIARFPYPFSPAAQDAYDAHVTANEEVARLDRGFDIVTVATEQGTLPGHLRQPNKWRVRGDAPLVVVLGGIDEWKADPSILLAEKALRRAGYATLSLDIPGTGQNPAGNAEPDDADVLAAAVRLAADGGLPGVDGTKIAVYGISFGGHYSAYLALTEPAVDAAVNLRGPLEGTFDSEWCADLPIPTLLTLAATLGLDFGEVGPQGTRTDAIRQVPHITTGEACRIGDECGPVEQRAP